MADLDDCADELIASLPAPPPVVAGGQPFAAILAGYLAQSSSVKRASAALATLRDADLLEASELAQASPNEIAEALRGAGLENGPRHAGPLRRLAEWWLHRGESATSASTETLRDELLALRGIGPATADAILLRGLDRPTYPVDRATYRILIRHGWIDSTADYDEARAVALRLGSHDPSRLAHLATGLERIGADYCRVAVARCEDCPLRPWLPEGGPRQPE